HECAADRGDADKRTEDETESDGGLAEGDDLPEDALPVVVDHELDEATVPVVGDRGLGGRRGDRGDPLPEGEDSLAVVDVVRRRAGVEDLVPSGVAPAVADVDPDDQP